MPKININMQWLIPLASAIWAVWTWAADHERDRKKERARIAALYVNPFLSACEDLQSRIYSILELGGLGALRKRYPDGFYAEETLYLIVRCFGWMWAVERHGPYTQDPVMMRLASSVRSAFATASSAQQVQKTVVRTVHLTGSPCLRARRQSASRAQLHHAVSEAVEFVTFFRERRITCRF